MFRDLGVLGVWRFRGFGIRGLKMFIKGSLALGVLGI